jgi:endonuclease/exonuclease/phosphatase (EEP) superfamily protein YafD
MNDDDDDKKRKDDRPSTTSENEEERPNKRRRVVELPRMDIPDAPNLLEGLRQLGSSLALVSSQNRIPSEQVSVNFNQLQQEINQALETAFREAQDIVAQNEQAQRAEENTAMAEAENFQYIQLQQSFLQRLQPLMERMRQELTHGEQVRMLDDMSNLLVQRLNRPILRIDWAG